MNLRSVAAALCAFGALSMAGSPAIASVGAVVLVETACTTVPTASFSAAPDGQVRGFVGTGCSDGIIDYVTNRVVPGGYTTQSTPYRGLVLATAEDSQATYLLYRATDGVHLTKVTHGGVFTHGNRLSAAVGGGLEGTVAARGGGWFAVWTEPKASGGFALHGKGSTGWTLSPSARMFPAGVGVDDSAPALALDPGGSYNLAWTRHTASGFHLMFGTFFHSPWTHLRTLDSTTENPTAASLRNNGVGFVAYADGAELRLADTVGGPMHPVPVPQPPAGSTVTDPRVAYDCGRLFVGFRTGGENSGRIYVDTLFKGRWVQHLVTDDHSAAPELVGISPHCASGAVVWTSAGRVYSAMVA
jgi:hypothetical protein